MRQSGDSIVVNCNKTGRWATAARSSFASDDKTQSEIDECSQSKGSGDRPPVCPYWGHCYLLPERRVPLIGGWKWVMIELIKWSALVISHRESCGFEAAAAEGHRTIEWNIWPNPTTQWGKSIALSCPLRYEEIVSSICCIRQPPIINLMRPGRTVGDH